MPKPHAPNELYEFDDFRLDVSERSLWRGDTRIPVPDRAFETLCALVRRGNHLVSKDHLMREVWQDTVVEENNLAKSISALRKILGEQADGARFIETVRGRGFRFIADVRESAGTAGGAEATAEADSAAHHAAAVAYPTGSRRRNRLWLLPTAIAALAGLGFLGVQARRDDKRSAGPIKMRLHLAAAPQQGVEGKPTNLQADEAILKGDVYLKASGVENGRKAVAAYQQALAIDPDYALAHARLSESYRNLANSGAREPQALTSLALAAAQRASELDPDLAEAQLELANLHLDAWNWAEADARFQRAIELNPHLSRARRNYAAYLGIVGRSHDAIVEATRTRHLDPQTLSNYRVVAYSLYAARRYDDAIAVYEKAVAIDSTQPGAYAFLGHAYRGKGMYRKAIAMYQVAIRLGDRSPSLRIFLGAAYAQAGDRRRAHAILEELRTGEAYVAPGELAALYTALGQRERAFAMLEDAYALHDPQLQYLIIEPGFDPLRDDPRYGGLLDRVGLRN